MKLPVLAALVLHVNVVSISSTLEPNTDVYFGQDFPSFGGKTKKLVRDAFKKKKNRI